jgi:HEAT repeat protein
MRRKTILALVAIPEMTDGIVKSTLTLTKKIYSPLMMLIIFGGMFINAATAQNSLQTKILATAAQPTTDTATRKKITELIAQLGDENDSVRSDAAWNLSKIADSKTDQSFLKREAVQPLIKALADKNPAVRKYAASALGKIGDLTALQPLINALEDSDSNVRLFAANALGVLGNPQAEQPLNNLLKDKDARVQKIAARALKQIKIAAQQQLKKVAPKEQLITQEGQVEEIDKKQVIPLKSTDTQKRIDGYVTQLSDPDVRVRNRAAQHLKAIGKPAEQSLIKALEDSSSNPPQPVVILLGDVGGVTAIKPLYKILNEGKSSISRSAGSALGKIKSRVTSEEWDREVQEYRDDRRLEMEKEMETRMAKKFERLRSERQSRTPPIRRPPVMSPRPLVVQPTPAVEQPSPTIGKGFLLRPRNMSIPVFIIISIMRLAISSVTMSIFIKLGTKIVVRYDIAFGDAWTIAFLIALITFFIRLATAYINEPAFYVFLVIFQLGVAPFIYSRMIDYGEGPIGFGKGFLIHICSIVATVVVIFGIIFILVSLAVGARFIRQMS